jgi:hypothetical protein
MPRESAAQLAIARAEALLPGVPAAAGARDPRWQAIIRVGEFISSRPEEVWQFTLRWSKHPQRDLRAAIATCLLEHLLEDHFDAFVARVRLESLASVRFASTLMLCWCFGPPEASRHIERLKRELRRHYGDRLR